MGEVEPSLYNELKRNKFSGIPKFSEEDVANVWESVSRFVERQMTNQKGVHIPGLGTFTFSQRTMDVGHGKQIVMQRPVFQLAEKFAQIHALNYTKHYVTAQIPILQLNFTAIASETPYPRETVESCIKEVLQALSRSLHVKRNVEFIFTGIGCLSMRDSRVKMKFYKEFIKSMDNTGELVNALRNRPDTTDSILSDILTPRPATGNTVILPRITLNPEGRKQESSRCESRAERKLCLNSLDKSFNTMATIEEIKENQRVPTPVSPSSPKCFTPPQPLSSNTKHALIEPELENPNEAPQRPRSASSSRASRLRQLSQPSRTGRGSRCNKPQGNKDSSGIPLSPVPQISSPKHNERKKKVVLPNARLDSGCSHNNKAGQELCYLCHQRTRKNIPVYLAEEKARKENEEDRLLQQYQHDKDVHEILNERTKNFSNRKLNEETAAFNLGVAEAINEKKNARAVDFNRSYLFRQRAFTPPHYIRQSEYSQDLDNQVNEKNRRFLQEKSDQDFLERLEQVQLAEDLARQREQYLQDKKCNKEYYCEALNAQVQFKPLPIPAAEPDSKAPIFGIHDATPEKTRDQRQRARTLYQEQLAMVADKKRAAILRDLTTQREESDMLERIKQEMQLDRAEHFREAIQTRRALEKSWAETHRRKKQRETDENTRTHTPGMLIHEQCDKYYRCDQCGRRPWNCGESNIWRESRYIAGSRLIV